MGEGLTNKEFLFNYKFNLHKSSIPIGIDDMDLQRLSAVYAVPYGQLQATQAGFDDHNRQYAQKLLAGASREELEHLRGLRIAFLGDSITSDRKSYFNILRTALRERVDFADLSVSGFRVVDLFSPAIPAVCAFRPNIAHIMIGSNDIKRSADHFDHPHLSLSEYRRTLRYIIKVIMERGTDVLISTIPPLCIAKSTPAFAADNVIFHEEDRLACNDAIRALADEEGCFLNDMEALYAQYPTDALTEDDGLHLNANGQFLLAQAIFKRLASIAAKRT